MAHKKKETIHYVGVQLGQFDTYDLEGLFDDALASIQQRYEHFYAMAKVQKGWDPKTCRLEIKREYRRWEEGYDYNIYMMRPENESEKADRLKAEKIELAKREEWERRQYEELSKKFRKN